MIQQRTKLILITALVAASLFFLLERNVLPGLSSQSSSDKNLKLLKIVMDLIRNDYVEEPNADKTIEGAFKGLISTLDPLSSYLDPENLEKYREGKEAGLRETGAIFYKKSGAFSMVIGVKQNSPAEKKGLKIGDYVSEIDGKSTMMLSMTEANLIQKSKTEKPVSFKILRTDKSETIQVERAALFQEAFSYSQEEKTSGILRIHHFFSPCVSMIKEKILPQLKQQKQALIIDLRNCHEGDIGEAQQFINIFLQEDIIGYLQNKKGERSTISCKDPPKLGMLPLVVWTNRATMGPAEAVAAVLQDFKKAEIVGFQTPGLVARQDLYPLEDGSGLLLTSEIFLLPQEKDVWQKGVMPDKQMEDDKQDSRHYLAKTLQLPLT